MNHCVATVSQTIETVQLMCGDCWNHFFIIHSCKTNQEKSGLCDSAHQFIFLAAKINATDTGRLRLGDSRLLSVLQDLQQWSLCASRVRPGRATKWTTSASGRGCSRTRRPSRCPDGSCPEACVSRSPTIATRPPSTRRWLESHTVSSQATLFIFPLFFFYPWFSCLLFSPFQICLIDTWIAYIIFQETSLSNAVSLINSSFMNVFPSITVWFISYYYFDIIFKVMKEPV